jgi:hypothetical protein
MPYAETVAAKTVAAIVSDRMLFFFGDFPSESIKPPSPEL